MSVNGISEFVPASFAGFGIEPSNLFYFTGGNETNGFSIQLLQNLADYSGKPASIRVGGNTQDYMLYSDSIDDYLVSLNKKTVGQGDVAPTDFYKVGPRFFEAIDRFPSGTPITFGLNMAYYQSDYLDQISAMAEAAVTKLTNTNLTSFEIGNEPNIYLSNGFRNTTNGNWTGAAYVKEWKARAQAIYSRALQPNGLSSEFFEAACTASLIDENWGIEELVADGMQDDIEVEGVGNSTYLTSWNQHDYLYFIGQSNFSLTLEFIMGLNNTEWQFGHWADQVGVARSSGLPYHLREMGSVGPLGQAGVSDTFGAALWTLNFFLYGAAISMSGINLHMTQNSYASAYKPRTDSDGAQVIYPTYYAYAAMAQLVGSGNGTTQITRLSSDTMPAAYDDYVRMYAGYGEGRLTSVVIINAMQANASDTNKSSLNVSLSLDGYKGQTLFLSYLTAPGADSTNNTVWNGMQYSDDDGTPTLTSTNAVREVVIGDDGTAVVSVRDSQAVIAYIGARLGTNKVLLNSTIPDDTDGGSGGNSTSTGTSTTDSSKSAAKISADYPCAITILLIVAFWTCVGGNIW
ncbi:hypothetical protein N0V82_007961 [Gnomoniopsis sp. IMI 355080]|nr:hypothetical protein N0V82_007961 [Gnomoniopsis sp. IMI 355080]